MDNGIQPVTDSVEREMFRTKAKRIHLQSAALAIVLALVGVVL